MDQWRGKVAFVTGASSGIGYNLSKRLCELGMNVIGCARNVGKIEELSELMNDSDIKKAGRLLAVRCDVSQEEDVKAAFQRARAEFGGVDVCVNNAGVAYDAPLLSGATSDWKTMLDVNILGVCMCTREFMAQLKERSKDSGHIFLINGLAGHITLEVADNILFYGATKHAITALAEGIRRELRQMDSNVKITAVSPGCVRSEFLARLRGVDDIEDFRENAYTGSKALETDDVTAVIVHALVTPPRVQIHDVILRPIGQQQ